MTPTVPKVEPARASLFRIFTNMGWLGLERVVRSGTALLVTVWIARSLGPEQFGLLNYAQSLTAALYPLAGFGLAGILVRDLVQHPEARDRLLSAAILIRAGGGVIAVGLATALAVLLAQGQSKILLLVWILSLTYLAQMADSLESDYQSRLQNGVLVAVKTTVFAISTAAKILVVMGGLGVAGLAGVMTAESGLIAAGIWVLAQRQGHGFVLAYDAAMLKGLLRQGWPFLWVGLIATIYQRLDQLLLGYLGGIEALGIYAAAWKILEALAFAPMLAMTVLAPVLSGAYRESPAAFRARLMRMTRWLFWAMLGLTLLVIPAVQWVVPLAFGEQYAPATRIFGVLGWALPLIALNGLCAQWALNVNQAGYLVEKGLAGLLSCLGLGLLLIPESGFMGAAVSVVASQAFATLIYGWFRPAGREILVLQARAVFLGHI